MGDKFDFQDGVNSQRDNNIGNRYYNFGGVVRLGGSREDLTVGIDMPFPGDLGFAVVAC